MSVIAGFVSRVARFTRVNMVLPLYGALAPAGPAIMDSASALAEDDGLLLAVPKRKTSVSRRRIRQNDTSKQLKNVEHFYPCPKCEHGYLKLRHHLCPCEMRKLGVAHEQESYGSYRNEA
jgi:ribosomal protein L32